MWASGPPSHDPIPCRPRRCFNHVQTLLWSIVILTRSPYHDFSVLLVGVLEGDDSGRAGIGDFDEVGQEAEVARRFCKMGGYWLVHK